MLEVKDAVPPLTLRNSLREGLAFSKVVINPLRPAVGTGRVGGGRPVMVIPGMLTGDISTSFLRRSLGKAGFSAYGWGQGLNVGASERKLAALQERLTQLRHRHGQSVAVIGWSLGGLYARVLAHRTPEAVELCMTVASPFSGDRRANRAWRLYEMVNDHAVDAPPFAEDPSTKPRVPTIAVWSAVDEVVAPICTMGHEDESDHRIRLDAQHFELGSSKRCVVRIIEILAQHLATAGTDGST